MTEAQLIPYLAGFFDGEGTISLGRYKNDGGGYRLAIAVSQNERSPLEMFQATFGGRIYEQKWEKAQRAFYSWQVTNRVDRLKCLEMLSPFLIVKKREAEIALAFLRTMVRSRYDVAEKVGWTAVRTAMYDEMKTIKRGRTILGMKEARN